MTGLKRFQKLIWIAIGLLGVAFAQNDFSDPSQPTDTRALERCTRIFSAMRPQLLYVERANQDRFWIRAVFGVDGLPVARLTVGIDLTPVPLGLEDIAMQALRPVMDRNRILKFISQRFDSIGDGLMLGNWTVNEPKGYRCFLTYQGRVVGVIRLNERLLPRSDPKWINFYRRSLLRFPVEEPVIQTGQ